MEMSGLYHGNFIDIIKLIPPASIDAIITDPPYLTTDLKFDKKNFGLELFLSESLRVVKPNGYLACFAPYQMLAEISKVFVDRFSGVWIKPNGVMRTHSAKLPRTQNELYGVFAHPNHEVRFLTWNKIFLHKGQPYFRESTGVRKNIRGNRDQLSRSCPATFAQKGFIQNNLGTRQQTNIIYAPNKICMKHAERTDHPTQKPIFAIETLIKWLTNKGDLILDPFAGSGTTLIAAKRLNRRVIGFEIDKAYYDMAKARIENDVPEISIDPDTSKTKRANKKLDDQHQLVLVQ